MIRMRFQDFTGKFVYHCHVLGHENAGMMGVLEVALGVLEIAFSRSPF